MKINADLHTHSIFAGGAGGGTLDKKLREMRKRFVETQVISQLKGVNYLGTGDVQFDPYLEFLEKNLVEEYEGLYTFETDKGDIENFISSKGFKVNFSGEPRYVLQTELIFTAPFGKRRKKAHVLILFPHFNSVRELNTLLDNWGVARERMARPFVLCSDKDDVALKVHSIMDLDPHIEFIPAHVMTPEGVYGGDLKIDSMGQFFGESVERIKIIETGLSADPDILSMIPELDNRVLISNADAHSSALNRLGREFTSISANKETYRSLIDSIRSGKILKTAEFHPTEGRYFLTGHRENRKKPYFHRKGEYCYYSPNSLPEGGICPICNKQLTIGVLQRAYEISGIQGNGRKFGEGPKRPFVTMVPLIEIIGFTRNIKTLSSKKLVREYIQIIEKIGDESKIWTEESTLELIQGSNDVIENIKLVREGKFCFSPPGYDGTYGRLRIGETYNFEDVHVENFNSS